MCREAMIIGKVGVLQKYIKEAYNDEIRVKLTEEMHELEKELEDVREWKRKHYGKDMKLTERVPIIALDGKEKIITDMKWGIKFDPEQKSPLIFNSRDDTITDKPFWKKLFDENRILIPLTAFYEWIPVPGQKKKKKLRIVTDTDSFFVPGLFWENNQGDKEFSLITTSPNLFMSSIHNRMPVILDKDDGFDYLFDDAEANLDRLKPSKRKFQIEDFEEDNTPLTLF